MKLTFRLYSKIYMKNLLVDISHILQEYKL